MSRRCSSAPPTASTSWADRAAHRGEPQAAAANSATLVERWHAVRNHARPAEPAGPLAENSIELRAAVERRAFAAAESDSQAAITHQQAIEGHLGRLVEETLRAPHGTIAEELRATVEPLARRTQPDGDREALRPHRAPSRPTSPVWSRRPAQPHRARRRAARRVRAAGANDRLSAARRSPPPAVGAVAALSRRRVVPPTTPGRAMSTRSPRC